MSFQAVDFETTGFNAYKGDKPFAYILTDDNLVSRVYRLDTVDKGANVIAKANLHRVMKDEKIIKIAHNAKFEMGMYSMMNGGVVPKGQWHDTLIMSQMLRNLLRSHKLEVLAERYCSEALPKETKRWGFFDSQVKNHMTMQKRLFNNYPSRIHDEIIKPIIDSGIEPFVTDRPNYGLIPAKMMKNYQIADGERCMLLFELMYDKITQDKRLYADYLNEMKLLFVAQKMEQRGMMIDTLEAEELIESLELKLTKIHKKKKVVFGFDINLNSPDQLQKHLYGYIDPRKHDNLNMDWKKMEPAYDYRAFSFTPVTSKGGGGTPSTSKDDLIELQKRYPKSKAFDMLIRYRAYSTGITMVKSYIELAGEAKIIHPNMNTNQAKTGRQSVSNPNLQNVVE